MTYKENSNILLSNSNMNCEGGGVIIPSIRLYSEYEGRIAGGLLFPSGDLWEYIVDFGDGSALEYHTPFDYGFNHVYPDTSMKIITIYSYYFSIVTDFDVSGIIMELPYYTLDFPNLEAFYNLKKVYGVFNSFSGILPSFENNTELEEFELRNNNFSGELPSFENCTKLWWFYCENNEFTGCLPDFSSCTELEYFNVSNCMFSDYTLGSFTTQKNLYLINLYNNYLSNKNIDDILFDCVLSLSLIDRITPCALWLNGVNMGTPGTYGYENKTILQNNGWIVYTN